MQAFSKPGGRLLKIAGLFVVVCVIAIGVMTYFTQRALADIKEIGMLVLEEGQTKTDVMPAYMQLIENMKISTVIGSLSGLLIAIVARYGLRETSRNVSNGMSARANGHAPPSRTEDTDDGH
jgi:hypothetical protein